MNCRNPTAKFPKWVALIPTKANSTASNATSVGKVRVQRTPEKLPANNTAIHSCVAPLFKWNNSDHLLEWMEFNLILGVNHFTFYLHSASSAVRQILELYRQRGVVTIVPWQLPPIFPVTFESLWPPSKTRLHYGGQIGAYNDCLYRNMHRAKWLMVTDLDELIVPKQGNITSLHDVLGQLRSKNPRITSFLFSSYFFARQPGNFRPFFASYKRKAQILTNNCTAIHSVSATDKVAVHNVVQKRGGGVIWVNSEIAGLHHYRLNKSLAPVEDRTAQRYVGILLEKVRLRKSEFGLN